MIFESSLSLISGPGEGLKTQWPTLLPDPVHSSKSSAQLPVILLIKINLFQAIINETRVTYMPDANNPFRQQINSLLACQLWFSLCFPWTFSQNRFPRLSSCPLAETGEPCSRLVRVTATHGRNDWDDASAISGQTESNMKFQRCFKLSKTKRRFVVVKSSLLFNIPSISLDLGWSLRVSLLYFLLMYSISLWNPDAPSLQHPSAVKQSNCNRNLLRNNLRLHRFPF